MKEGVILKKILIVVPVLIFVIIFVLLCISSRNVENVTYWGDTIAQNLDIESITPVIEVEINDELAYKIGRAVLESVKGDSIKNRHFSVEKIVNKNIYIVSVRLEGESMLGGGISVAIDGADGGIIKVWPGE